MRRNKSVTYNDKNDGQWGKGGGGGGWFVQLSFVTYTDTRGVVLFNSRSSAFFNNKYRKFKSVYI